MQQSQAHLEDSEFDNERRLIYKGSALVRFEYLRWNTYVQRNETTRIPDPEHIQRIKRIFAKEGCRPLQAEHHIPAVVDQHQLQDALEDAQSKGRYEGAGPPTTLTINNTDDKYPELEFPSGIECLCGRHRIQAGKEWLSPADMWWIVDLYLSGISYALETLLVEEYTNAEKPCDGEIYRKIRKYQFLPISPDSKVPPLTCISLEMRWWARFNKNREKRLKGLFKSKLAAGFDSLMKIPGLFDAGMIVTTLHTIMATKCNEEILCYLQYIATVWDGFLEGIERDLHKIEKATVKALELRAPGSSTLDAQFVRGQILGGAIFHAFSALQRTIICQNVLAFRGIIPSLFTFFRDVHLLRACADSLRWLVEPDSSESMYTMIGNCFVGRRKHQGVQTRDQQTIHTATLGNEKRLGYLHLVAFTMREYNSLPRRSSKENRKEMSRPKADPETLQRLAALADRLGFQSASIDRLKDPSDPDQLQDTQVPVPHLVTAGPGLRIEDRCGFPRTDHIKEHRKYLYLTNLCEERDDTDEGITSFFALKCWFTAFYDPPRWKKQESSTEGPNLTPLQAAHEHMHEEDANMESPAPDLLSESQQLTPVPNLSGAENNTQIQDIVHSVQQRMSTYAKEANRRLEVQPEISQALDHFFVPRDSNTSETEISTIIRFVERKGIENDMVDPLSDYGGEVLELRVDRGDPHAFVEGQVQEFLCKGKRTCDRYKKNVLAEECYDVAIRKENNSTLFLIPDIETQSITQETEEQVLERGHQVMQEFEIEHVQDRQEAHKDGYAAKDLEDHRIHLHQGQDGEDDSDLLDREIDNAINAHILGENTITIYLKRRTRDSHDVSKPAREWEWTDAPPIQVQVGDPQDQIIRSMERIWREAHLKPHDSNLNILAYEDCYSAALEDEDHSLYLMAPSMQTVGEKSAERTLSLVPLPPTISKSSKEKLNPVTSSSLSPKRSELPLPPPSLTRDRIQQRLVKSTADVHRDKMGRGPNQVGKDGPVQRRVGLGFKQESTRIRKGPGNMRISQRPDEKTTRPGQTRRLMKPQVRKAPTTLDNHITEVENED